MDIRDIGFFVGADYNFQNKFVKIVVSFTHEMEIESLGIIFVFVFRLKLNADVQVIHLMDE